MDLEITILRLNHRPFRDKRITTHVFLAGRAFGAVNGIYTGEKDKELEDRIGKLAENFGGKFSITYEKSWKSVVQRWLGIGKVVHLTMYGMPFEEKTNEIEAGKLLVVVGSEKVPSELYKMADYNISITNQPHSEVSALGVFMYALVKNQKINLVFTRGKLNIIPSLRGKNIVTHK